jgi:Ca2+-transporting ATPase
MGGARQEHSLHETHAAEAVPHTMSIEEVVRTFGSDLDAGLGTLAAAERRTRYGRNELARAPRESAWRRLARQFGDLLIWVLIAAALVSGALGEWLDAIAILAIVVLNGVLGFVQEGRAEQALEALRKLSSPQAKVTRDGRAGNLPAAELVPGDRVDLEPGDRVPADLRLVSTAGFRAEEAALTGESLPTDKDHGASPDRSAPLGDRANMAYMGTTVAAGTAGAIVVSTGMGTEIGQIAGLLQQEGTRTTPLQRQLAELGKTLVYVVLGVVAVMFLLQVWRGGRWADAFLLSVSLAVAAIPEGLSAVVTVALALGLQRMARRNALIRRLPSVETLGAVTVICTDKTGTLTRNEMTVREIEAGGNRYDVTGGGYEPAGTFRLRQADPSVVVSSDESDPRSEPALLRALTVGAWCGHAVVARAGGDDGKWALVGDPTEGALVVAAMKANVTAGDRKRHVVREIPFSSDRKLMSVVARTGAGSLVMYSKGAPEVVLGRCNREAFGCADRPLTDARRQEILHSARGMGERSLRVLGLAYRDAPDAQQVEEEGLTFAGLAGMMDPPRDEARAAVGRCLTAGVRPVMITGDHPETAKAIALELGIMRDGQRLLTGTDLDRMGEAELAAEVEQVPVYARVTAAHKLQIVKAWQAGGQVVAMTGDGVNDAPAIKAADVGVAMGVTGTDVTKAAADMVLTDDNFASIVNAVEQGRTIYDNVRKFVHYLLATNAGEVLLMFGATLAGWPPPLLAIQLLWINLVTDALPAMALGVEPPEPDVMQRSPRPPGERVITGRRGLRVLYHGGLNAAAVAVAFYAVYRGREENLPAARTAAFWTLAFAQLVFSLACRSDRFTLARLGVLSNPWLLGAIAASGLLQLAAMAVPFLQPLFKVAPLPSAWDWLLVVALALAPAAVVELTKLARSPRVAKVATN